MLHSITILPILRRFGTNILQDMARSNNHENNCRRTMKSTSNENTDHFNIPTLEHFNISFATWEHTTWMWAYKWWFQRFFLKKPWFWVKFNSWVYFKFFVIAELSLSDNLIYFCNEAVFSTYLWTNFTWVTHLFYIFWNTLRTNRGRFECGPGEFVAHGFTWLVIRRYFACRALYPILGTFLFCFLFYSTLTWPHFSHVMHTIFRHFDDVFILNFTEPVVSNVQHFACESTILLYHDISARFIPHGFDVILHY